MRTRFMHERRAVAMLLVLISLMLATILTTSYLASRDNSSAIGDNVAAAAAARWAADAGLEMGLALLQTEANWRSASGGALVTNHPIGPGSMSLVATDVETGGPPNPATQYVELKCMAEVNGVQQSCGALVHVPLATLQGADLDLSEFAIFASNRVTLSGNATVARWPMAPLSAFGPRLAIGTSNSSASSVVLQNEAIVIDGTIYGPPDASNSLVSSSDTLEIIKLPTLMPMPSPSPSNVSPPDTSGGGVLGNLLGLVLNLLGMNTTISSNGRYDEMSIQGNSTVTMQGNIEQVSDTDLRIRDSKLRINGNVKIVVFDDFELENSAIELMSNANLTIYVADQIVIRNSYIGQVRPNNAIDTSGLERAFDAQRVRILRLPSATHMTDWTMVGRSAVKSTMYAPMTRVRVREESAVYGRVAAYEVEITDIGAVFYDPALNLGMGFTSTKSPIYNSDGTPKTPFKTLASLDTSVLQSAANTAATRVISPDRKTVLVPVGEALLPPTVEDITQPTPRPVQIAHRLTYFGTGVSQWE